MLWWSTNPVLAKELFNAGTELVERQPSGAGSISVAFGPGSTFSLAGDEHRERRKLLAPPFHGKRMRSYDRIIEEEVMREIASWPEGREFETLEPMLRITVGAILRAVFGAEGPALEELRETVPAHGHARLACWWCARRSCARTWVRGVRGAATCGSGVASTPPSLR